jgi:rfaE bifunctional protein nucleotidyltransferase chain/domain
MKKMLFSQAMRFAENELLGDYASVWPLTKILDIGGDSVIPSFSRNPETPPIPCHLHSGHIHNGKVTGSGKVEAYFFPELDCKLPRLSEKAVTRLGLKPGTTNEAFVSALKKFGIDDEMYSLFNECEIKPNDGWTIPSKVLHSPGPWTTFEIQTPQDDFNLASWNLGKTIESEQLSKIKNDFQLKGVKDEEDFLYQLVDWEKNTSLKFKEDFYRPSKIIEMGVWGKRRQIFFDCFYGESIEVNPGETFRRIADKRPFAGIVWFGKGKLNDNELNYKVNNCKEFLVTPNSEFNIVNTGKDRLIIYSIFPINTVHPYTNKYVRKLYCEKIKTFEEISTISTNLRKQGKKIVSTNGSFDIIHSGHILNLQEAKAQGDVLILGLNSDSSIRQYKSPDRPIVPQEERAVALAAMSCVDYVCIFNETSPNLFLEAVKPDVHVKSKSSYKAIEEDTLKNIGASIYLTEDVPQKSTTNLIKKILEVYSEKKSAL